MTWNKCYFESYDPGEYNLYEIINIEERLREAPKHDNSRHIVK